MVDVGLAPETMGLSGPPLMVCTAEGGLYYLKP